MGTRVILTDWLHYTVQDEWKAIRLILLLLFRLSIKRYNIKQYYVERQILDCIETRGR